MPFEEVLLASSGLFVRPSCRSVFFRDMFTGFSTLAIARVNARAGPFTAFSFACSSPRFFIHGHDATLLII